MQPWDAKGFRIPGGAANSPAIAGYLPAFAANLRKQLKGAPMPAPRAALAAAVEGSLVDIDTALSVETRYLVSLMTGQVAKNMISTFFDLQKVNGGASRPADQPPYTATKVGVMGAGMMGAAIAYVCAKAGIDVVLKDVTLEAAQRGKGYAERLEAKAVERGRTTPERSADLLARISPTADASDFSGVDLVIEAVFESVDLKQQVFGEIQDVVMPDAVLGSNTSTLPITLLAEGVSRPEDFIGIHFFSPVDKMPLVEIIRGERTSDAVLAKDLRLRPADPQDAHRRQRPPGLLHLPGDRHVHQRGSRRGRARASSRRSSNRPPSRRATRPAPCSSSTSSPSPFPARSARRPARRSSPPEAPGSPTRPRPSSTP